MFPDELLPDELLPDELLDELPDESSEPELPEPEELSSSEPLPELPSESPSSERPDPPELPDPPEPPEPPPGDELPGVVGAVGSVDPVVVALPAVVPPAGGAACVPRPRNTPSTPSCRSGLQWSEPSRSSAATWEQVTVSMVRGVAATATPWGRKPAALMTTATATGRHTFCPNISGGPPDDLLIGPRVDADARTT